MKDFTTRHKKSVRIPYLLLILRFKAFALTIQSGRATQKAHAEYVYSISIKIDCAIYDTTYADFITYPRSNLHCFDLGLNAFGSCEVLKRQLKSKRYVNANIYKIAPTPTSIINVMARRETATQM